jgi:hypothetical protein
MAMNPFFEGADEAHFDIHGQPVHPGRYEFRMFDGRKVLYTLEFMEQEEGQPPRLRVAKASRMQDYPIPAHALKTLDGQWVRYLGEAESDGGEKTDPDPEPGPGSPYYSGDYKGPYSDGPVNPGEPPETDQRQA